jgi:serine/threonine protein kinase
MPAELSLKPFLHALAKSRLIEPAQLDRLAEPGRACTARELAERLVRSGDLTQYQSAKLLRGHWRGLAIGPYRILAPLGRGGMGTVYLARDTRLAMELGDEVLVALKVLTPRVARQEPRMLQRFERELEIGLKANHPNVARTLAGGVTEEAHYIAMEYVPGKTLRQIISEQGVMAVGEAARVFADVAAGLTHLHERGLIHRDLKPANVMVTRSGQAKILDLGLALAPYDPRPADPAVIGGEGYILGTMDYISPEQARNATTVGPRSDLYSLGCSLYYALAGTPPFPGGTAREKIHRQRTLTPPSLQQLNPTVPADFVAIVEQLMAKDSSARPPSAIAARDLLLPWATAEAGPVRFTVDEAVRVVDRADLADLAGPESDQWTEDLSQEHESTPQAGSRAQWLAAGLVAAVLITLMVLFSLLRQL